MVKKSIEHIYIALDQDAANIIVLDLIVLFQSLSRFYPQL